MIASAKTRRQIPRSACALAACAFLLLSGCRLTASASVHSHRNRKPPPPKTVPFYTARGLSRGLQKYSGANWLTNACLSSAASLVLSLKTGGFVRVKVQSFGFTDLLDGEFKSVEVTAHSGKWQGVPFGKVHLVTGNPFKVRYLSAHGKRSGLCTPVAIDVSGTIDESALGGALNSKAVTDNLRFLKFELPGLGEQHLQVLKPSVHFTDGKVQVDSFLITAGAAPDTGIKLKVIARPVLEGGRYIKLADMDVQSPDIEDPTHFGAFAEELFNPLVDFGRYDRLAHAFRLKSLQIKGHRVEYAGNLLLAPKAEQQGPFTLPAAAARASR